ncbi:thioredoxin-like protein [Coniochaeta ligniaria NRRL 30616]|uniref:Thioredoxin-like protein n=1 Tax=Coniochaeta ligniaria NRRL 30616 TaxID=1408157 RepID=A0A1J7JSN1_9PEZI|nr:thioredoxin-like protein [Coniochaeta ligniaria NRRL 30616]
MGSNDKLVLYTNHRCPWAHRAHIALSELGIPFEEEIIDLDTPRTEAYLKVNPRGLVPSLRFNDEIITESGIVSQFLADAYPSHLLPPSNTVDGALRRARVAFFVDTFFTKFQSHLGKFVFAKTDADANAGVEAAVAGLVKEVEPLLKDAKPFFGGAEKLTLAEVLTGSFAIRIVSFLKAGLYPASLGEAISTKAPNFDKWVHEVAKHPSVTSIYQEDVVVKFTKARLASNRAS